MRVTARRSERGRTGSPQRLRRYGATDACYRLVTHSNQALAEGMKAFECSAAQRLNRAVSTVTKKKQRGQVFVSRYFARVIRNPTQAHRAINYVLNNWRKHHVPYYERAQAYWDVDYFSSAPTFDGWHVPPDLEGGPDLEPLPTVDPLHFFLSQGWRRAGSIHFTSVPSSPAPARA